MAILFHCTKIKKLYVLANSRGRVSKSLCRENPQNFKWVDRLTLFAQQNTLDEVRPLLDPLVDDVQPVVVPVSTYACTYYCLKTYFGLLPSPTNIFSTLRFPL